MSDSVNSGLFIVNFNKKRSVPNEIPSEVEVSVVKMIVITRDDCISSFLVTYVPHPHLPSWSDMTERGIDRTKVLCKVQLSVGRAGPPSQRFDCLEVAVLLGP